jgi:lipopolysaccharide transport system permease protein
VSDALGEVVIQPSRGWIPIDALEIWRRRDLLGLLVLRDLRLRHRQTVLGPIWSLGQPLLLLGVFTGLFRVLLGADNLPSATGAPYALTAYAGLVTWRLLSSIVTGATSSLVTHQHIMSKTYFPRLLLPLAPAGLALVDFAAAFATLVIASLFFGAPIAARCAALPLFVGLAVLAAVAVGVWLSALNALRRDVQYALNVALQVGMYATPVVYDTGSVMPRLAPLLRAAYLLNPMAHAVEGVRWALLGGELLPLPWLPGATALVAVMLFSALVVFRRVERTIVDVV